MPNKKEFVCIESLVEFTAGQYKVRVWRDENELQDSYDNMDLMKYAESISDLSQAEFARRIANFDRVNAVQVKSKHHAKLERVSSLVVYKNW